MKAERHRPRVFSALITVFLVLSALAALLSALLFSFSAVKGEKYPFVGPFAFYRAAQEGDAAGTNELLVIRSFTSRSMDLFSVGDLAAVMDSSGQLRIVQIYNYTADSTGTVRWISFENESAVWPSATPFPLDKICGIVSLRIPKVGFLADWLPSFRFLIGACAAVILFAVLRLLLSLRALRRKEPDAPLPETLPDTAVELEPNGFEDAMGFPLEESPENGAADTSLFSAAAAEPPRAETFGFSVQKAPEPKPDLSQPVAPSGEPDWAAINALVEKYTGGTH